MYAQPLTAKPVQKAREQSVRKAASKIAATSKVPVAVMIADSHHSEAETIAAVPTATATTASSNVRKLKPSSSPGCPWLPPER